jgi:hypothetical protein
MVKEAPAQRPREVSVMAIEPRWCPFLVPVTADQMFVYPVSAFCRREAGVRVPAASTLEQVCGTLAYTSCPGFLATIDQDARADGC